MTLAARTLTTTLAAGTLAAALTLCAVPALAHGGPGDGPDGGRQNSEQPHHMSLAQAKSAARTVLAKQVGTLTIFTSIAAEDTYVPAKVRRTAVSAATVQMKVDKRAEAEVREAETFRQLIKALESARPSRPDHSSALTLAQQKYALQLVLDNNEAVLEVGVGGDGEATEGSDSGSGSTFAELKKEVRAVEKIKQAVAAADSEKQLVSIAHTNGLTMPKADTRGDGGHRKDAHSKGGHAKNRHSKGGHAKNRHSKGGHAKNRHSKGEHAKNRHSKPGHGHRHG